MSVRFLITSAALLAIAAPAYADCNQEVERLSEAVTQAETGASTDAAMPATPHQEEVLAGEQQGEGEEAGGASSADQANVPASPPSTGGARRDRGRGAAASRYPGRGPRNGRGGR
jgi:hypothetical protein